MNRLVRPLWLLPAVALTACAPQLGINDSRLRAPDPGASLPASAEASPEADLSPASPTPSAPPVEACLVKAGALPVADRVGQLFMVGVSTGGLDETTRSAIADNRLGSVVLLGNTTSGAADIRMLSAELGSLGSADLPLLVSVDQEGGNVQRLQGEGFTRMPTGREQGKLPPGQLAEDAFAWGTELRSAGVRYDLAPSADVVPEDRRNTNAPIGKLQRDFGSDPELVGEKVTQFIAGMHEAGVVTSVKHFPGLGLVETNTDFGAAKDTEVTADSAVLDPFRAAIEAGVDSVMVSSAVYEQIDPDNEAMFSSKVVTDLLRGELGYDGVVISDDLGAAKSVEAVAPADRGVRFLQAGGDLVINADPLLMGEMVQSAVELAGTDAAFEERVTESTARVLKLKEAAGLAACG